MDVEVEETVEETVETVTETVEETADAAEQQVADVTSEAKLAAILAAQPEEVQARYGARNPAETLGFLSVLSQV